MTDHASVEVPEAAAEPGAAARFRLVKCPACSREMERVRFGAFSDVVIDVCALRHGVWLDGGQLQTLHAFVAQRERIGAESLARAAEEGLRRELERKALHDKEIGQRALAQRRDRSVVHDAYAKRSASWGTALVVLGPVLLGLLMMGFLMHRALREPTGSARAATEHRVPENRATAAAKPLAEQPP